MHADNCPGWFIDAKDGRICECAICGRYTDEQACEAAYAIFREAPPTQDADRCSSDCLGWALFETNHGYMICRCDDCAVFADDDAALATAAAFFYEKTGKNVLRDT